MGSTKVTIAGSMALVALAAGGLAALRNPTRLVASLTFSLAVVAIVGAGVAACCRRGKVRAFWGGYAACGGIYLLLSLGPGFEQEVGPHLVTTALVDLAYERVVTAPSRAIDFRTRSNNVREQKITASDVWTSIETGTSPTHVRYSFVTLTEYSLHRVAHSLLALAAATAGGLLAVVLSRRPDIEAPDHP